MIDSAIETLIRQHLTLTGDGNIVGNDNTVRVTKQTAGDYAVQIGEQHFTVTVEELRRVLSIEHSQVGVIGDNVTIHGGIHHHYNEPQAQTQANVPDIGALRDAVEKCSALLRQHKHTIANTGEHLPREVVEEIVAWAQDPPKEQNVAMLLDQAGMGKTVVMRDVLCVLEELGMVVLAIKADQQLSGISKYTDLPAQLQLPDSVESVITNLTTVAPVIILLDQIDALSLSLSHAQVALNIAIELLARLRLIPGVRILFSCRKFDYDSDPKLNAIEVKKRFSIPSLSEAEITEVLRKISIHFDILAPETRQLLRIPLHLDLFVRVLERSELKANISGINSLQALYHHLWLHVILRYGPDIPAESDREEVVRLFTDYMNDKRTTAVPHSVITASSNKHLQPAVRWLASAGILIQGATQWSFLHQTFFDYCYARHFVESGRCLSKAVVESDQGLFARSQLHQVIAYLREVQPDTYLHELNSLLATPNLRFHLRDLLLRWFGSLPNPTNSEHNIAKRMFFDPMQRPKLLHAIWGNSAWFAHLRDQLIGNLSAQDDQILDQQIIPYLGSLLDVVQSEIIHIIRPYLNRSEQWNQRLAWLLFHIRVWHTIEAVELLEQLVQSVPTLTLNNLFALPEIVRAYPQPGCRIIKRVFDSVLDECVRKREIETEGIASFVFISHELESLHGGSVESALEIASQVAPRYFVETMLSWLTHALTMFCDPPEDIYDYGFDSFATHWYDDIYTVRRAFVRSFIEALITIAQVEPPEFRKIASQLASLPGETPQLLITHVYRRLPHLYAQDACHFLLTDQRRLNLGDSQQYDSRKLIQAIVPHLSTNQRADPEAAILATFTGIWKPRDIVDLQWRGIRQLYLLQAIPVDLLTEQGRRILGELERKFPGERASDNPRITEGGFIDSPIPSDIARKMSNRDWLHALQKYQKGVRHREFLKGGAEQLARVLTELIKETPERFYLLLKRLPDTIDTPYVEAFLNGLAESDAPVEWLFNVVRRFALQPEREITRTISWALRKRVQDDIPDDMVILLEGYVRKAQGNDETRREQQERGLGDGYYNSDRGSALVTLMRIFDQRKDVERKWELIEYVAGDPSAVLRAGAIQELSHMLRVDRERAITLFENLLDGYAPILKSQHAQEFLHYAIHTHFSRMKGFVRALLESDDEPCQQRGAELACMAAVSPYIELTEEERAETRAMAEEAVRGSVACRRGVAHVYAVNVDKVPGVTYELAKLLDDEDEQVQNMLNSFLYHLQPDHIFTLRSFLEAYAASRAMRGKGLYEFTEYLWRYGQDDPQWALSVIDRILDNTYPVGDMRWGIGSDKLVRLTLNIYHDPTASSLRGEAMDVFDRLMECYPGEAQKVLRQWDDN